MPDDEETVQKVVPNQWGFPPRPPVCRDFHLTP